MHSIQHKKKRRVVGGWFVPKNTMDSLVIDNSFWVYRKDKDKMTDNIDFSDPSNLKHLLNSSKGRNAILDIVRKHKEEQDNDTDTS